VNEPTAPTAVIDIGGSGAAVWHLNGDGPELIAHHDGAPGVDELALLGTAAARHGDAILVATPGQMDGRGLLHAGNLGWNGLSLLSALELPGRDVRWVNDAAAIAAGERALLGLDGHVMVLVFGTGLGVAVADAEGARTLMWDSDVEAGHMPTGDGEMCACGRTGCLELLARRWVSTGWDGEWLADCIVSLASLATPDAVVLSGGALLDRDRTASLRDLLVPRLDGVPVLPSAAPEGEKSAAPHGTTSVWPLGRRPG
jgi:predicted NBD/HSP70 family sugar kinase